MASRRGFTLVELLITVTIIAIMASMVLVATFSAQEAAKRHKTRVLIAKLNDIIMARYDEYRTRRVPIASTATTKQRLDALRDLMRLEMPDRWSDVYDGPVAVTTAPSAAMAYRSAYASVTGQSLGMLVRDASKEEYQNAECLYMIVMRSLAQQGDGRDVFKATDIGDVDADGFPEFLDAWGMPIRFLRWAPGFMSELQTIYTGPANATANGTTYVLTIPAKATSATRCLFGCVAVLDSSGAIVPSRTARITGASSDDGGTPNILTDDTVTLTCAPANGVQPFYDGASQSPPGTNEPVAIMGADPFDSRGVYPLPRVTTMTVNTELAPFALYPLIYSAGSDRCFGIKSDFDAATPLRYSQAYCGPLNPFPFSTDGTGIGHDLIGETGDFPLENHYVRSGCVDNVTNHSIGR